MDSRQVLDFVNDIERRYPVGDWTVDGLSVWPLMRVRAYVLLVHHFLGTGARGAGMRSPVGRVTHAVRSVGRLAVNQIVDFRGNALPRRDASAVLLSDGVSMAELEGRWYDRFMDPIIGALRDSGRSAFLMMPMNRAAVPRYTPSLYVQPLLDAVKVISTARSALTSGADASLDGFEAMAAEMNAAAPGAGLPGRPWLVSQARRVLAMAGLFERLIARTSARAAFVNTYYSAEGMAFVLAARRRGCVTVDVQHGIESDHVAYGGWLNIPAAGFELLPDIFWVWGPEEARRINQGRGAHPAHRAVAVGNLWERSWREGRIPGIDRFRDTVATAAARFGARRHVLVTPGFGHSDDDLRPVLEAIAASPPDVLWWLRLHPSHGAEGEALAERARAANPGRVEVEAANAVPLPVLLEVMTANVTQASTTVVESRNAGVPSIITTGYGASIFRDEIQAGRSIEATTSAEILAGIETLSRSNPLNHADAEEALVSVPAALADLFSRNGSEAECR